MKFAKFWKSVEIDVDDSPVFFGESRVSIWGASNESSDDAQKNAETRAERFRKIIFSAEPNFHEYEYWSGYIKEEVIEEVVSEDGRIVAALTRNHYGALVLNSETVFFGDIDVDEVGFFDRILEMFGRTRKDKAYYINKVEEFQKSNSQYTFKVYETRAGLRVAITNHIFDSNSSEVHDIFIALDTDPLYVTLCKHQSCFRARLSPKPWRIDIEKPLVRYPWKTHAEEAEFSQWLRAYEYAAKQYGVVKLLNTFGSGRSNSDVERVLSIHDYYACVSNGELA